MHQSNSSHVQETSATMGVTGWSLSRTLVMWYQTAKRNLAGSSLNLALGNVLPSQSLLTTIFRQLRGLYELLLMYQFGPSSCKPHKVCCPFHCRNPFRNCIFTTISRGNKSSSPHTLLSSYPPSSPSHPSTFRLWWTFQTFVQTQSPGSPSSSIHHFSSTSTDLPIWF